MRHIGKEVALCIICVLCDFQRCRQCIPQHSVFTAVRNDQHIPLQGAEHGVIDRSFKIFLGPIHPIYVILGPGESFLGRGMVFKSGPYGNGGAHIVQGGYIAVYLLLLHSQYTVYIGSHIDNAVLSAIHDYEHLVYISGKVIEEAVTEPYLLILPLLSPLIHIEEDKEEHQQHCHAYGNTQYDSGHLETIDVSVYNS